MTQKKLTALGIATLPARHRPYPDHVVAGLGLRIGTNEAPGCYATAPAEEN